MQTGSGVDIEYEQSNVDNRDGKFKNCKFKYNIFRGMICDADSIPSTLYFSRDVTFENDIFVGSQNGVCAFPNARKFEFKNCTFVGQIWRAYRSEVQPQTVSTDFDNTKFDGCTFLEEYTDLDILPLTAKSFGTDQPDEVYANLTPDTTCPQSTHHYLIDFSLACRVSFKACDILTNFTMLLINLSATLYAPNVDSYNDLDGNDFYSSGVNQCACDFDLTALYCCKFPSVNRFYHPFNRNGACSPYSCTYLYNPAGQDSNFHESGLPPPRDLIYLPVGNLVHKYTNTPDPNIVTQLFSDSTIGCPFITITPTYPICVSPRLRNPYPDKNKNVGEFTMFPNPSSDFLTIENIELETTLKICNIMGNLVLEQKTTGPSLIIDLRKLPSGVYILYNNEKKAYKFIKL